MFDLNGDYYVAVPLDAPPRMNPKDREELRLEAQLLANLFTSFEKEKIFTRVLMPYISVKQIQKKLWKQGSKFAHAETFRLYKFKDGAWSEIILGAIMGAAKRVETEKRRRRIEDDVFTRHEPRFTGALSQAATHATTGQPLTQPVAQPMTMPSGMNNPATYASAPQNTVPSWTMAPAQQPMPARGYATASAFGPYAAAAQMHAGPMPHSETNVAPYPHAAATPPLRRTETTPAQSEPIADLRDYKQRLEQQSDVAVRVANNNTAPAQPLQDTMTNVIPMPQAPAGRFETALPPLAMEPERLRPVDQPREPQTVKVEAIERKVVWHMPAGETTIPPTLAALLQPATEVATRQLPFVETVAIDPAATQDAAAWVEAAPRILPQIQDTLGGDDEADDFEPWSAKSEDDTPTMASRFAPATKLS